LVPTGPGWTVNTLGGGTFTLFHPDQGSAIFGYSPVFAPPGGQFAAPQIHQVAFPASQAALPAAAAAAFVEVGRVESSTGATVTAITPIPGTVGMLGDGFISELYAFRYDNAGDGKTYDGLLLFGASFATATPDFWQGYFSFMAVPTTAPGGAANALIRSWSSWDGSPGRRAAFSTALAVLARPDTVNVPFETRQFREENRTWVDLVLNGG
jgi:hypothetical protein